MLGLHGEAGVVAGVVAGQEVLQHRRGLIHGPSIGQAEFGYQPVLEGPRRPFHPALGLGRAGEDLPDTQLLQATGELSGFRRSLRLAGVVLEYRVPVAVQRQWNAPALDQALQQREVSGGVLAAAKHGVDHGAAGVVHRQQQGEFGTSVLQPGVMTAVQLQQHPRLGHPLAAKTVRRRAAAAGTADAGLGENAAHRGPAQVDALPLTEQFGEVGVVGALVAAGGQFHHGVRLGRRDSIVGTAATVTVGQRGGAMLGDKPPAAGEHVAGTPPAPRRPGRWEPGIPKRSSARKVWLVLFGST